MKPVVRIMLFQLLCVERLNIEFVQAFGCSAYEDSLLVVDHPRPNLWVLVQRWKLDQVALPDIKGQTG